MKGKFFARGIHLHDEKSLSAQAAIERLAGVTEVVIPLSQHIGKPALPIAEAGQAVKRGQLIAKADGYVSANIHASVAGTVKAVEERTDGRGAKSVCVVIEASEKDETDFMPPLVNPTAEEILARVQEAGIVGMGGAGFPTHVKLTPKDENAIEYILVNGAECEPYLTSDYRIMLERSREIVVGAAIMKHVLGGCRTVIGIEENKPEAIRVMSEAVAELQKSAKGYEGISVMSLKKKYPQGGEKQLIDAVMGRQVKSMGLPIDVGAVVQNVATSLAVYEAVQKNMPLVTNVLTVTGDCLPADRQHNYKFRIGMPLSYVAEYAGGVPEQAAKIISGGPMMGKAIANPDAATVKGSSSLLYLTAAQTVRQAESACIRCGKCADACPMGLEPFLLNKYARNGMMDELEENAVQDCIECGCCLYSCPANIPLLDIIRIAKGDVIRIIRGRAAQKK